MKVILDSNIFCSDYHLKGNNFRLLLDFFKRTETKLAIPKIVLLEVKNNYRQEMLEAKTNIDKEIDKLAKRIGKIGLSNPLTGAIIIKEADRYSQWLDDRLKELETELLGIPEVDHESIIIRAIEKKKPFKSNGDGYRDTLIWETVLSNAKGQEEIIFITKNSEDFCRTKGSSHLHDDLKLDLESRQVRNNLRFFTDVKEYLVEKVLPNFSKQEEIEKKIANKEYPFENINQNLKQKVRNVIGDFKSGIGDLYFESEFTDPRLLGIDEDPSLQVDDVRKINENEIYVSAEVRTFASYSGLVRINEIGKIDDCFNYWISDVNSRYYEAVKIKALVIKINFIYSNEVCNISNIEIEDLEEI